MGPSEFSYMIIWLCPLMPFLATVMATILSLGGLVLAATKLLMPKLLSLFPVFGRISLADSQDSKNRVVFYVRNYGGPHRIRCVELLDASGKVIDYHERDQFEVKTGQWLDFYFTRNALTKASTAFTPVNVRIVIHGMRKPLIKTLPLKSILSTSQDYARRPVLASSIIEVKPPRPSDLT